LSRGYEIIEVPCLIKIKQVFAVIDEVRCYFVQFSRIFKNNILAFVSQFLGLLFFLFLRG
jgi:hypothetical protein